jgi:hypothetical protein
MSTNAKIWGKEFVKTCSIYHWCHLLSKTETLWKPMKNLAVLGIWWKLYCEDSDSNLVSYAADSYS